MTEINPYIRIVCEGLKTEPNYLNGWLRANQYSAANPAFKAKDNSPRGVVKEAKKLYKEAYRMRIPRDKIHIWAVFDRDGHVGVPEAINEANDAQISFAFSNISFEYWILLHFAKPTRAFENCDSLINYIQQNYDPDYGKSNDHYSRLKERINTAIENGKWLVETHWRFDERPLWDKNPFTNVHEMLESIKGLL